MLTGSLIGYRIGGEPGFLAGGSMGLLLSGYIYVLLRLKLTGTP